MNYILIYPIFIQNNSHILDIGCSTGNFINSIRERHANNEKIKYVGIDNTKMINFCKKRYKKKNLSFLYKNIENFNFQNAVLYLHFIQYSLSPKKRGKINR